MADETTTTWAELLREAKGPLTEALKFKTVLLSEVRRDKSPINWHGTRVTVPIYLTLQQGTHGVTETGTVAVPVAVETDQAYINSATLAVPISFSPQLMRQSAGDENSWASVLPSKMRRAEDAFGRVANEQMVGGGKDSTDTSTALLGVVSGAGGSPGLTVPVSAATFNKYQLYPGRIVDVRNRTTGTLQTGGKRRRIASVTPATPSVTFSTAAVADGDSGAITYAATDGIYIDSSVRNVAGALTSDLMQGVGQAVATTGTFEGIAKGSVPQWQGIDASPGSTTDPAISVFDKAEREVMTYAGTVPNFYLSDPAVVDKYTQGITVQARWAGETGQLDSGWTGVQFRNKLIIPEYDMPPSTVYGIALDDMAMYTLDDGPDWDDLTGDIMQRFSRSLPVEAWLIWMVQLGFHRCNSFVKIGNLSQAS
jgi:hypothetical protein